MGAYRLTTRMRTSLGFTAGPEAATLGALTEPDPLSVGVAVEPVEAAALTTDVGLRPAELGLAADLPEHAAKVAATSRSRATALQVSSGRVAVDRVLSDPVVSARCCGR